MTWVDILAFNTAALCFIAPLLIAARVKRKKAAKAQTQAKPPQDNAALLDALKTQLDMTCEYALALQKAAQAAKDDLKRARLSTQAAAAYSKAAALQTRINKLTT